MTPWQQSVENRLTGIDQRLLNIQGQIDDLRRDLRGEIRTVLYGGIAAVVALAGMMARGFGWI